MIVNAFYRLMGNDKISADFDKIFWWETFIDFFERIIKNVTFSFVGDAERQLIFRIKIGDVVRFNAGISGRYFGKKAVFIGGHLLGKRSHQCF